VITEPQFELARLILNRCATLALDAKALGIRLGYRNPAKAAGRVQALCDGHVASEKSRIALKRLAHALDVDASVIDAAVAATLAAKADHERAEREAQDARWRTNFVPHAVILTELTCPSQIVMCGMTGGIDRWLLIRLNPKSPPIGYLREVRAALPRKLETGFSGEPIVPFFGRAKGFVINYKPDHAVRFDLQGQPEEVLRMAYRPGVLWITPA
jgi:hypothetical protein